ncbi:MAG: ribosome assembly cofactor RimP, partial [Paramuribaculum sp.]|nr:ribosome assembly cofactor RimP [Paramuribaculum sp.]
SIVEEQLEGTDGFLVDVRVSPTNVVTVEIDSMTGVDIDTCARLTRAIEEKVDREVEDYELEVGSAGLTSPFKVAKQYEKNIGNDIEVLTRDGRKLSGTLQSFAPDGESFVMTVKEKVKEPGKKRPVIVDTPVELKVADTKSVKYQINFK